MGSLDVGGGLIVADVLQEDTPHILDQRIEGKREVLVQILFFLSLFLLFLFFKFFRVWEIRCVTTMFVMYQDFFQKKKKGHLLGTDFRGVLLILVSDTGIWPKSPCSCIIGLKKTSSLGLRNKKTSSILKKRGGIGWLAIVFSSTYLLLTYLFKGYIKSNFK